MADNKQATTQTTATSLNVPEDVQNKFPELVGLIKGSQSMNDEERQYWIDVLPIMTEDQLVNLNNILGNEKKQIEDADKQYEQGVKEDVKYFKLEFNEVKYKEKKLLREKAEKMEELAETKSEESVLAELAKL
jgi:hypothetical protein